jgi:ABC-2 type transport system permease protein
VDLEVWRQSVLYCVTTLFAGVKQMINPLTLAIEPIRAAYAGQASLSAVVLDAPYGSLTTATCLLVLAGLAAGLFLLIRPLLDRKLS